MDDIGICNGDEGTLTAIPSTTGGVYTWTGYPETSANLDVNPTVTTSYSVVYELNNCESLEASAAVTVTDQPSISVSDIGIMYWRNHFDYGCAFCFGGIVFMDARRL